MWRTNVPDAPTIRKQELQQKPGPKISNLNQIRITPFRVTSVLTGSNQENGESPETLAIDAGAAKELLTPETAKGRNFSHGKASCESGQGGGAEILHFSN